MRDGCAAGTGHGKRRMASHAGGCGGRSSLWPGSDARRGSPIPRAGRGRDRTWPGEGTHRGGLRDAGRGREQCAAIDKGSSVTGIALHHIAIRHLFQLLMRIPVLSRAWRCLAGEMASTGARGAEAVFDVSWKRVSSDSAACPGSEGRGPDDRSRPGQGGTRRVIARQCRRWRCRSLGTAPQNGASSLALRTTRLAPGASVACFSRGLAGSGWS